MEQTDRLITIAIHTYDKAHELKNILECEGIKVTLQNVNLTSPVVSSGIRVRIKESDLPMALRLIENIEIFSPNAQKVCPSDGPEILVPVDFSKSSMLACQLAFHIAALHKARIKLLHSYFDPIVTNSASLQLTDSMTFDGEGINAIEQIEEDKELSAICKKQMADFETELREKIKDGLIPPVVFTSEISEGLPEEVINDHASAKHPLLIVMGTRGSDKQNRDMLGSVTAEVLDSCRSTIFTVPESLRFKKIDEIREVVYLASTKQQDILALDALYRLLPETSLSITLASLPSKKKPHGDTAALANLLEYCRKNYPAHSFKTVQLSLSHEVEDFNGLDEKLHVDVIAVPTPRKNIFARLFNPTLAHKLLFHSDIPMLSIPV
ncbi:MAG: universal stress protein [Staphylococcus sp.]|nr:universal stress protein [Staphylococcus sp.]